MLYWHAKLSLSASLCLSLPISSCHSALAATCHWSVLNKRYSDSRLSLNSLCIQSIQNVNRKCSSLPNDPSFTLAVSSPPPGEYPHPVSDCLNVEGTSTHWKKTATETFCLLSLPGWWDEDPRQAFWSTSVPILAEHQSDRPPPTELCVFRECSADHSEGFPLRLGKCDDSDGAGVLQHRAQRRVQVETKNTLFMHFNKGKARIQYYPKVYSTQN